jgi:glyoxylase-like metal-dependent hydrolase (beta-lactamase superfamily II)
MAAWQFTKGLHDIGNGLWAYLQPDGSWGWSNAGLITDGDQCLLVDTLFDLKLTGEMLDAMRAAAPVARRIPRVVNTHNNGDHVFGNQFQGLRRGHGTAQTRRSRLDDPQLA